MDSPQQKEKPVSTNPPDAPEAPGKELNPKVVAVESRIEDLANDVDKIDVEPESPAEEVVTGSNDAPVSEHEAAFEIKPPKGKLKRVLTSKVFWFFVILLMLAAAVGAWFFQPSRTWFVNLIGLRVPVTVTTRTVAEPGQPSALLKKAKVSLNGVAYESDDQGLVHAKVPYGSVHIVAEKSGFESASLDETYDFNPFIIDQLVPAPKNGAERTAELRLKSVGVPLKFSVLDWLTGKPLATGSFSVGDIVAQPDEQGLVSLKVPPTDDKKVKVKATFGGSYNDREFEVNVQADPIQKEVFVPAGKNYFVSKRTGNLGVYSSDLDGSKVTEVVPPSANETSAADLSVSPSGKFAVLASTREAKKDSGGQIIQRLYVVNLSNNQLTAVDEGLWFDFVDWSGDVLVYTTAKDTTAQRLASIDVSNGKKADLSTAKTFGAIRVSLSQVVYLLSVATDQPNADNNPQLTTIPAKGGTEKSLGYKVSVLTQTDSDRFAYQTADNAWHAYNANTNQVSNVSAPASSNRAFLSSASPDGQSRLVVDRVDGKTTLLLRSIANGQEKPLSNAAGLRGPIRWVGKTVVFRVVSVSETADYVVSYDGGEAKKITDITASSNTFGELYFGFN